MFIFSYLNKRKENVHYVAKKQPLEFMDFFLKKKADRVRFFFIERRP